MFETTVSTVILKNFLIHLIGDQGDQDLPVNIHHNINIVFTMDPITGNVQ